MLLLIDKYIFNCLSINKTIKTTLVHLKIFQLLTIWDTYSTLYNTTIQNKSCDSTDCVTKHETLYIDQYFILNLKTESAVNAWLKASFQNDVCPQIISQPTNYSFNHWLNMIHINILKTHHPTISQRNNYLYSSQVKQQSVFVLTLQNES